MAFTKHRNVIRCFFEFGKQIGNPLIQRAFSKIAVCAAFVRIQSGQNTAACGQAPWGDGKRFFVPNTVLRNRIDMRCVDRFVSVQGKGGAIQFIAGNQ